MITAATVATALAAIEVAQMAIRQGVSARETQSWTATERSIYEQLDNARHQLMIANVAEGTTM